MDDGKIDKATLDKAKDIMLNILLDVDKVCREHDIKYMLACGTLLGAVRHGGFIPWDDDLDIYMPREDYNKFNEIAKTELPSNLFLQTTETDPSFSQYFSKVRDNNHTIIERYEEDKDIEFHQGIFIDIFPIDFVNDTKKYFKDKRLFNCDYHHKKETKIIPKIGAYLNKYVAEINKGIVGGKQKVLKGILENKKPIKGDFFVEGYEVVDEVTVSKDVILPLKEIEFCGKSFYGPNNPHEYLSAKFGDYMTIPDEKDRHIHAHSILIDVPCKKVQIEKQK